MINDLPVDVPYLDDIRSAAELRFGVPAPLPLLVSQIRIESGFDPKARSSVGAVGLMQLMPATARWIASAAGFAITPLDPVSSINGGIWLDAWLHKRVRAYDSPCDRWMFAMSAYNGGELRVWQRQLLSERAGSWPATGYINPGISAANQRENESYGPKIARAQLIYAELGPLVCSR